MKAAEVDKFWSRIFTFVPTPTKDDGETIDESALRRTLDFQIENGVSGVCLFGSTGGNGSFSDDEMRATTAIAARHIDGRIPIIVGTGARTTAACIKLSMHAQDVGCNGVMILPVSYWPLTPDEVYDHYARVTKSISVPVCLYNNPWTTGLDMKPDFLARLAQLDNVSCVKESTGDLTRISSIRQLTKGKLTIIAGWESSSLQAFAAGATAWAPVVTNFMPAEASAFFKAAGFDADFKKARALWDRLYPICEYICAKSHIRVAHSGLEVLGRPAGPPRRPLRPLNASDRDRLKDLLAEAMGGTGQRPQMAAAR